MKRKTSGAICQADTQYLPVMSFMKADIYLICKLKHFQIFKSRKNHQSCPFATELFWMAWKAQCQHHQLLSGTEARYHLSQSTKHINSDVKYWCTRQSISSNPFSDVWHLAGQPQGHMHQYFELLVVKKMIKMSEHQRVVVLQAESLEEESEDLGSVLSESLLPFRWENIFKWKMELWPLVGMTGISLNKHIWGCHWSHERKLGFWGVWTSLCEQRATPQSSEQGVSWWGTYSGRVVTGMWIDGSPRYQQEVNLKGSRRWEIPKGLNKTRPGKERT